MTPAEISALVGVAVALGAAGGWIGKGIVSTTNTLRDIETCQDDIAKMEKSCSAQRAALVADLKAALTDAIKLAIKEMELEIAKREGSANRELGEVKQQVSQIEKDIENIFIRLREVEKKVD